MTFFWLNQGMEGEGRSALFWEMLAVQSDGQQFSSLGGHPQGSFASR